MSLHSSSFSLPDFQMTVMYAAKPLESLVLLTASRCLRLTQMDTIKQNRIDKLNGNSNERLKTGRLPLWKHYFKWALCLTALLSDCHSFISFFSLFFWVTIVVVVFFRLTEFRDLRCFNCYLNVTGSERGNCMGRRNEGQNPKTLSQR